MWRRHIDFFILISITIFLIPFYGSGSTIDPVLMPRFCIWGVMTFILLASLLITLLRAPGTIDYSMIKRMIFPAFLGYLLFSLISLTKAVNVTEGVYEVLKISLSIAYLFVASIILGTNKIYISILVKAVIAVAAILPAIGIYQYLKYDTVSISATMANKNQLSSALFLMLPFCLYAVFSFHKYWKIISTITTILILLNIFLLQTRAVWGGLLISVVTTILVVGILFKKLQITKKSRSLFFKGFIYITIILIIAISFSVYFSLKSYSIDFLIERIQSLYSAKHETNIERILIWSKSLEVIENNLIFGSGAGNWKIVLPSYGLDNLTERSFKTDFFQRPHNDYIWVLFEIGLFGFIFYLSIFGIIISYTFRSLIQHSYTNDKLLSIFIFFGIVGYMVISFFSFPKERIFHSMFLLLMMAIVTSIYHKSFSFKKTVSRQFMLIVAAPFLLLLAFAIIVGYIRLKAEIHTKRAFAVRRAKNWPMVIAEIDKGHSAFATLDHTSTPLHWYRGEANYLLKNYQKALEDFKKAYRAHPYHIHVLNNLATCYEIEGDHKQAIFYYKKALEIHSEFEDALINLGATYYNSGRYEQAYETLLRCDQNRKNPTLERYLEAVKEKLQ